MEEPTDLYLAMDQFKDQPSAPARRKSAFDVPYRGRDEPASPNEFSYDDNATFNRAKRKPNYTPWLPPQERGDSYLEMFSNSQRLHLE